MPLPPTLSEVTGPVNGYDAVEAGDADSSRPPGSTGLAVGERITVTGRVLDEDGRPVPDALLKVWQANAAGASGTATTITARFWTPTSLAPAAARRMSRVATTS